MRSAWNWNPHVTSSCHRIIIYGINRSRPDTRERLDWLKSMGHLILPIRKPLEFDLEDDEHYKEVMNMRGGNDPEE